MIREINIEYHGMRVWEDNDLEEILEILKRNNFSVEVVHKEVEKIFPKHLLACKGKRFASCRDQSGQPSFLE